MTERLPITQWSQTKQNPTFISSTNMARATDHLKAMLVLALSSFKDLASCFSHPTDAMISNSWAMTEPVAIAISCPPARDSFTN